MIVKRQKIFGNLQDGFGGKKNDIVWCGRHRSSAYNNFGPWIVELSDNADDEYTGLDDKSAKKVTNIIEELKTKPYQGSYGQHPLWDFRDKNNECVVWSSEIDKENRLNYLIFRYQNYILVTNIGGHRVINHDYAIKQEL